MVAFKSNIKQEKPVLVLTIIITFGATCRTFPAKAALICSAASMRLYAPPTSAAVLTPALAQAALLALQETST